VRKVHILPNLLTLANGFCGLLAVSKGIDALALANVEGPAFHSKIATACWLVFLGMVFDALDGKVARIVGGASHFGAQLDSFSDMLTFGLAPALLVKVLVEHEGPRWDLGVNPRVTFIAAACFSMMAILRLARFNLETEPDEAQHRHFQGLPSPSAAGAVCSTMLVYLSLRNPELERSDGTLTPLGSILRWFPRVGESPELSWLLTLLLVLLPLLGLLMVSRLRYVHLFSVITGRGQFVSLVAVVFSAFLLFAAPVLALFLVFNGYVVIGLARALLARREPPEEPAA